LKSEVRKHLERAQGKLLHITCHNADGKSWHTVVLREQGYSAWATDRIGNN